MINWKAPHSHGSEDSPRCWTHNKSILPLLPHFQLPRPRRDNSKSISPSYSTLWSFVRSKVAENIFAVADENNKFSTAAEGEKFF